MIRTTGVDTDEDDGGRFEHGTCILSEQPHENSSTHGKYLYVRNKFIRITYKICH